MKIEDASPFLQVNAVAHRARGLIRGEQARTRTESRQPTAVALAELRERTLEVLAPEEAREVFARDMENAEEEDRIAFEATKASFEAMWTDSPETPGSTTDD